MEVLMVHIHQILTIGHGDNHQILHSKLTIFVQLLQEVKVTLKHMLKQRVVDPKELELLSVVQ